LALFVFSTSCALGCGHKPELDESLLSQFAGPDRRGRETGGSNARNAGERGWLQVARGNAGRPDGGWKLPVACHRDRVGRWGQVSTRIGSCTRTQACQHPGVNTDSGEVRFTGVGLASRMARERPQQGRPSHRRHARLHGTGTDRTDEPVDRLAAAISTRSVSRSTKCARAACRSPRPIPWSGCTAISPESRCPRARRLEKVPAPVSAIIMRLLVKTPEGSLPDRGRRRARPARCLAAWEAERRIDELSAPANTTCPTGSSFPRSSRARVRSRDAACAFDRMVTDGKPELVSGIGGTPASAIIVVNELHKMLVMPRGLLRRGSSINTSATSRYATLAQRFRPCSVTYSARATPS